MPSGKIAVAISMPAGLAEYSSGNRRKQPNGANMSKLLDDEGEMSQELEECLEHIFSKYCTPPPARHPAAAHNGLHTAPVGAVIDEAALDRWAQDTNGAPFAQETKDELREYIDMTNEGHLTLKGFLQIYALQTENDEEETWADLSKHGFNRTLRLTKASPSASEGKVN